MWKNWKLVGFVALAIVMASSIDGDARKRNSEITQTLNVNGSRGGSVSAGRFTVIVPAGAIEGRAKITITVPNRGAKVCELHITPAAANKFKLPVTLRANVKDAGPDKQSELGILYFNPHTQSWQPVPGSKVNLATGKVEAPLEHFSVYGVGSIVEGRSGW